MTDEIQQIERRFDAAKRMARLAGEETLRFFQAQQLSIEFKTDRSPVTEGDRGAELLLRNSISSEFPEDGIVGEEFGTKIGKNEFRWILDPIDGTKSFISGVPLYGTMVGLEYQKEAVLGVVFFPALNEMIYGCKDLGAWWIKDGGIPQKAQVSNKSKLGDCIFVVSEVKTFLDNGSQRVFETLQDQTYVTRTWGDCYGYFLVATGRVDIMMDPILNIWDAAAIKPIIEEAGGSFLDWNGESKIDSGHAFAANHKIAPQIASITRTHLG